MPTQFKVNQLAKDLGFKSKDIMDIGAEKGMDLKVQGALEPWQFDVLFETLTKNHQVKDIDRYIDGETSIPSRLPKKEEPPVPAVKPVSEEKSAQKDEKPAEKPVEKPSEKTTEKPAEKATEKPAEKQVSDKSEEKKSAVKKPEAEQPSSAEKHAPAPDKKQNPANMQNILNQQRMQAQMNGEKVSAPAPVKAPVRPQQQQQQRPQNAQAQRPQNNGQPQQQRPQNNNNGQFGQPRFQNNNGQNAGNRPQFGNGTQPQNRDNRFQQQRPQNNQRPQGQRFDGRGGFDKSDKDYVPSTPRETFKPQAIVRTQTPKGGDGQQKQRGATRIVDTRTSDIDLSKYDEKLDTFASEDNDKNNDSGESAKIKKAQAAARQQAANSGKMPTKQPFQKNGQKGQKKQQMPIKKAPLNVQIPDEIVVSDLAARLKVTAGEVVKKLMLMGVMANLNQVIDYDTAALVAEELGAIVTKEVVVTIEEKLFNEDQDKEEDLVERAPVVCVMGHVDHGKTSLLDAIRNTSVTSGEAGGITQHIGAYRVKAKGREITFLDTPGHEAFTAMRARGAQATDIAILVVAADDGIMPQTVEAINHAKAAGIDIIVAINKMDKPTANPDQIKNQLTKYDLVPEEWGGDTICVPVSALTHAGIDDLLENILLVADVKEYKANPNRRAKGIVIEAKLDKGRGPVATILVQNGTLKPGDIVIAGTAVGRVRAMTDHNGKTVKVAGPSVPVEITGLDAVPTAGDEFNGVENERMARELADRRRSSAKEENFKANARASLDDLFAQISDGVKSLNVIVKADVDGSVEAVKASLVKISNEEVKVSVIHAAVGGITEGDVMFAAASNAIIVGFNVRPDKQALDSAERQGVEIRTYRVIYECIDEITAAMKGMLAPKFRESLLGHVEVRQIFKISKVGVIAGSYVQDGKVTRAAKIRVVRDGIVISEDEIASLRREKDDVKEVMAGYECGIGLEKFKDIKVGDILEAYVMEEIQQ